MQMWIINRALLIEVVMTVMINQDSIERGVTP